MRLADTIKIRSKNSCIVHRYKEVYFTKSPNSQGAIVMETYKSSEIPFNVFVCLDYYNDNVIIEFSSKILGARYPELINRTNIVYALEQFNQLRIIEIDIDEFIKNAEVTSVDITCDYDFQLTEDKIKAMNATTGEYRRFKNREYKQGIRFTADVLTSKNQDSLVVYNKEHEIRGRKNEKFLHMLSEDENNAILEHFNKYKTRFEVNLKNPTKIKSVMNIEDVKLMTVLGAQTNPILVEFDKIFKTKDSEDRLTIEQQALSALSRRPMDARMMLSFIKEFDGNIQLIHQEAKLVYNGNYKALNTFMKKIECVLPAYNPNRCLEVIQEMRREIEAN